MPSVPVLTAPGESLQALPGGGARPALTTPDDSGAGALIRGLGRAGDALGEIAIKEQAKANEDTILQNENLLDEQFRAFQQSTANRVGHSAAGITEETAKWWNDSAGKVRSGMTEPQQRVFDARVSAKRDAALNNAVRFEHTEVEKARFQTREKDNDNTIETAALDNSDAAVLNASAKLEANARAWALQTGLNLNVPEQAAQFEDYKRGLMSRLHASVLASIADDPSQAVRADAYFKAHRHEFDTATRVQMQKVVETQNIGVRAQMDVDALRTKYKGDIAGAIEAARTKYGPEDQRLEGEVITRLTQAYELDRKLVDENRKRVDERALQIYAGSGGNFASIPPSIRAGMSPDLLARLALNKRDQDRNDRVTFDNMRVLAYTNPDAFMATDLSDPALVLNPRYRGDLERLKVEMQKNQTPQQLKQQAALRADIFAGRVASAGITDDGKVKALQQQFETRYAAEVSAFQQREKRLPDNAEAAQIAGNLLIYGQYDEIVNDDGFVFQSNDYPKAPFLPPSASEAMQTRGEAFLRGTGQDVTPAGMATYTSYRQRAIQYLQQNKQPVTETSISSLVAKYHRNVGASQ